MESKHLDFNHGTQVIRSYRRSIQAARSEVKSLFRSLSYVATNAPNLEGLLGDVESDDTSLRGSVEGRKFKILTAPTVHSGQGKIRCHLVVEDIVTGEYNEVSRFLVTKAQEIQLESGEQVYNQNEHAYPGLMLLDMVETILAS